VAGAAGVGVAVPFPGVDAVGFDLAVHLLEEGGFVLNVVFRVPVVVGGAVALTERALAAGEIVQLFFAGGHDPAWEHLAAESRRAGRAFENFAVLAAVD